MTDHSNDNYDKDNNDMQTAPTATAMMISDDGDHDDNPDDCIFIMRKMFADVIVMEVMAVVTMATMMTTSLFIAL